MITPDGASAMSRGMTENRETAVRLGAKGRRVFTAAGWNNALRGAGIFAGNWWIANYGPLRWKEAYARGQLGYTGRGHYPFLDTGVWMANFNSRARTEAVAKKGGVRFWVVIPIGHAVQAKTSAQFKFLPAREKQSVAREFRRALIMALQEGRTAHAKKQQARAEKRAAKKKANAENRRVARLMRSERRRQAAGIGKHTTL